MIIFSDFPTPRSGMKSLLIWIQFIILSLGGIVQATSQDQGTKVYFVSLQGRDHNPGTEDRPWRTIQKAADTLTAGETVYIKGGTYRERLVPGNFGRAGKYITYQAYPGHKVIIDGRDILLPDDWGGLFHIEEREYIKVSGLRIENAGPGAIYVR